MIIEKNHMTSDNNSICKNDWLRVMLSGQIWVSQITSKCTRWHQLNPHWGAQVLKDESVSMQMALDSIQGVCRTNLSQVVETLHSELIEQSFDLAVNHHG